MLKRQFSSKISTPQLDEIYESAIKHGAVGGKLLGAGGGGFFIFYVPPFCKNDLLTNLDKAGLKVRPFRFEPDGLKAWTARERKNQLEIRA
jgi:D-glycero-alpha-D-manno-heptose-7-phosphate kinase